MSGFSVSDKMEAAGTSKLEGTFGGHHSYSDEEKMAFTHHINDCLEKDPVCVRHMPLSEESMHLFERLNDGLILCSLINMAVPDTVDFRALNKKEKLNVYEKTENVNLALNAAKAIGCQVVNIGAQDIIDGKPILILGLVWQVIKIQLLSHISLKDFPELVLLLEEGEELSSFMKLPAEQILLRWVNYHLKRAGSARKMNNFGSDVTDCEIYSVLLNQINSSKCPICVQPDVVARAAAVIKNANNLSDNDRSIFIKPKDIMGEPLIYTKVKNMNLTFYLVMYL